MFEGLSSFKLRLGVALLTIMKQGGRRPPRWLLVSNKLMITSALQSVVPYFPKRMERSPRMRRHLFTAQDICKKVSVAALLEMKSTKISLDDSPIYLFVRICTKTFVMSVRVYSSVCNFGDCPAVTTSREKNRTLLCGEASRFL